MQRDRSTHPIALLSRQSATGVLPAGAVRTRVGDRGDLTGRCVVARHPRRHCAPIARRPQRRPRRLCRAHPVPRRRRMPRCGAQRFPRRVSDPDVGGARRGRDDSGGGSAGGLSRGARGGRLRCAGSPEVDRAGSGGRAAPRSCCCRRTPTAPTRTRSWPITARWPRPACRSWPTTIRSTPKWT